MILTISLIILLLINVIPCIYINLLLSLIILYNTVYHYVYDSNKINKTPPDLPARNFYTADFISGIAITWVKEWSVLSLVVIMSFHMASAIDCISVGSLVTLL